MSEKKSKGWPDLSNFIDQHLRELKWTSYGLGTFAVLILIRKLNMAKRFVDINQIPSQYITDSYTLQGHIRHINERGVLKIEHTPIIEMKWVPGFVSLSKKSASKANDECRHLSILPAGLDLNPEVVLWLKNHASGKHAWFQIFARSDQDLHCDIRIKKGYFRRISVSRALIQEGLTKVHHFQSPPDNEYFHKYLKELIALENIASRKGKGIWKEDDSWLRQRSTHFLTTIVVKLKRLFRRNKN